jgi:NADPH-dependent 2,4-dienoyl-CoA reductase/sulfur reductase-like enzyme
MYQINCDVAVIGAGPAGLAAAIAAKKQGASKVIIIERDSALGGILQQCIHPGFGLTYFKQELAGPEYANKFVIEAKALGVEVLLNTMVLEVHEQGHAICVNSESGIIKVSANSMILAMGCRERTRGAIQIPGTRPAGVYTAGAAQRLINRQNRMVGKEVVILGSGDIGMIMARRMTLEGAKVVAVVEIMDYLAGLRRNKVQCLDDFEIPVMFSHTITKIEGNERVEGVWVAKVDEHKKPIKETEQFYKCDTLLLSVGLIPENELSRTAKVAIDSITNGPVVNQYMQTSIPAIFACGNVVHVNDLADNVSMESEKAGKCAALYALGKLKAAKNNLPTVKGNNIRYISPQSIAVSDEDDEVCLYFRVLHPELNVRITATSGGKIVASKKTIKVNPGEIEHLTVVTSDLCNDGVIIDVVKEQ